MNLGLKNIFLLVALLITSWLLVKNKDIKNAQLPQTFVWAWQRDESLTFINAKNTGVAFYAGGVIFNGDELFFSPRFNSLEVPPETSMIAVIRFDNLSLENSFNSNHLAIISDFVGKICSAEGLVGCQLDFDARLSERDFYQRLIKEVRRKVPNSIHLSITALVSWCNQGSWLTDLDIDEVVPLFYRMGAEEDIIRDNLTGKDFMQEKKCHNAVGVSSDEPLPMVSYLKNRRIYIFSDRAWTEDIFVGIMEEIYDKIQ